VRPLDLSYAECERTDDDFPEAQVLLQRIRAYIGEEVELSPEQPLPWER
jgi:predicted Rdx family selenoprotein